MGLVTGVGALLAGGEAVKRRLGEVEVPAPDDLGHFLEEEGHQQGRDVCAIDVGVGHDDDAVITQQIGVAVLAEAATEREAEVGDFGIRADLVGGGAGDVEDLAADRQDRLRLAVPSLLGRAARAIAFDDEQFGFAAAFAGAIGELAGQAQLAGIGGSLALDLALGLAAQPLVHAFQHVAEERLAPFHVVGEEMVEVIAHRVFDQTRCLGRGQAVLGLALELRIADEDRKHGLAAREHVFRRDVLGLLLADQFGEGADALGERGAQASLVRAAIRGRDGVAVPGIGPVGP